MDLLRLIPRNWYDQTKKRFQDWAFKNSTDGSGISVIDPSCIEDKGRPVCEHIRAFYPTFGNPPIFWEFSTGILPGGFTLSNDPSPSGDDCHRNIRDVSSNKAKGLFADAWQNRRENFYICEGSDYRALQL